MSFNSLSFIVLFLPITLIIYRVLIKKNKSDIAGWFLILASLFFYWINYGSGIIVFALSLIINYLLSSMIIKGRKPKTVLALGVVFDLILLLFFKNADFLLPANVSFIKAPGISFYTFTYIALLTECYRGSIGAISLKEYGVLMTFFPKLMQGPICTPRNFDYSVKSFELTFEKVYRSVLLFSIGCFKKVLIADTLKAAVDYGFSHLDSMHTLEGLIIMLSYTLQLYFDFSGYTDMAIAVASLFGFDLPENFQSPYKARNICDFWKRWHITLTEFFTRYLYIPLGGNRKGKARTYINILIIFLVSGIWHGTGGQFIVWGLMHGVLFALTRAFTKDKKEEPKDNPVVHALKVFLTFLYVNVAWVFFRAPSIGDAVHLFKDIAQFWCPRVNKGLAECFNIDELWYVIKVLHLDKSEYGLYILMILILAALLIGIFALPNAVSFAKKVKINWPTTVLMTVLIVWCILSFEGVTTYIYVNF